MHLLNIFFLSLKSFCCRIPYLSPFPATVIKVCRRKSSSEYKHTKFLSLNYFKPMGLCYYVEFFSNVNNKMLDVKKQ